MIYYEDYVRDNILMYNKSKGNGLTYVKSNDRYYAITNRGFINKACILQNLARAYNFPCKDCKFYIDNFTESDSYCIDYSSRYGMR